MVKGELFGFWEELLNRREISPFTDVFFFLCQQTLLFFDRINWMNKLTLKDNSFLQFYFVYMWRTLPPF